MQSIHQSINQSTHLHFMQSVNHSTNQLTYISCNQSINQPINSPTFHVTWCYRYSVRAAAACAVGDDVTLWCHTASHQLSLSDPANQRLLTAAQRHLAPHQQRQQTQSAPAQPAGLQHGLQDRAASHGLATNSNDGGQMRVDKQNDVVEAQLGIDDAGEPMVNAVDVELPGLTGSDSVRSAGPAVHAQTVMHAEQQQGWNGSNGEAVQQNDDRPDQQHASLTGDGADSPQHHGNELEQDQNALGHSQQALGQQQRALDSFQAQFDIGSAAAFKAESMLCDALARTEAEGMLDEAPCRAESMLEVVQHLTANQREQDLPTYNAAQQQLRIRRVSLQLQHKLQVRLLLLYCTISALVGACACAIFISSSCSQWHCFTGHHIW